MQQITLLNRFDRFYLGKLIADLPEELLDTQPQPGIHSVRWILGHLAVCVDFGFKQLELPGICPVEWHQAYAPKSPGGTDSVVRPSRVELLEAIESGYEKLCREFLAAESATLDLPQQATLLKDTPLKTRGDLICHLLVTHFAVHLGQLSSIRRLLGKPALF